MNVAIPLLRAFLWIPSIGLRLCQQRGAAENPKSTLPAVSGQPQRRPLLDVGSVHAGDDRTAPGNRVVRAESDGVEEFLLGSLYRSLGRRDGRLVKQAASAVDKDGEANADGAEAAQARVQLPVWKAVRRAIQGVLCVVLVDGATSETALAAQTAVGAARHF